MVTVTIFGLPATTLFKNEYSKTKIRHGHAHHTKQGDPPPCNRFQKRLHGMKQSHKGIYKADTYPCIGGLEQKKGMEVLRVFVFAEYAKNTV
jgi:hypothetical protein